MAEPGRDMGERVVAVIPALNEAAAIALVVAAARAEKYDGAPLFDTIIVADNGSDDDTAALARAAGARVVAAAPRGYGAACLAGIAAAADADVIVFIDGDASVDLSETHLLLEHLRTGADLAIGVRRSASANAMSMPQRAGNRLATALVRLLWRTSVHDLGPFRAVRRTALARLAMGDQSYGRTVEMQVKAIQQGLSLVEVPVSLRPRIGRSKISGTVTGVIGAALGIFSMIARLWLAERRARSHPSAAKQPEADQVAIVPVTHPSGKQPVWETFMIRNHRAFAAAGIFLLACVEAIASGFATLPSPTPGRPFRYENRPPARDVRTYDFGKAVYAVKLACASCPLADQPLNEATARRFLDDAGLAETLSSNEYAAVRIYLLERFGLKP